MSSGLHDPIVSKQETESLIGLFKKAGAEVSLYWQNSGHELEVMKSREQETGYLTLLFPS